MLWKHGQNTYKNSMGGLMKQWQVLEQQDVENMMAMEINNKNQTQKPKQDTLQEMLGLGSQWMVVLYNSGERVFPWIVLD